GDTTAAQSPGVAAGPGANNGLSLPDDGDPANADSVAQMAKSPADYIAYLQWPNRSRLQQFYNFPDVTYTSSQATVANAPELAVAVPGTGSVEFQDAGVGSPAY